MIVCVDLDNTLCNLQKIVIDKFNNRYGSSYTMEDFIKYNISECLSRDEAVKMQAIYIEPGIYDSVKPLQGAQEALQKLIRVGHEVYIVTHSDPSIFTEKAEWIRYWFPFIDKSHIISMEHKWLFKCDLMVEDNLDNLLGGSHYDRICFDYPWNRDVRDYVYDINRVTSWSEVVDVVDNINQKWSVVAV